LEKILKEFQSRRLTFGKEEEDLLPAAVIHCGYIIEANIY
jgi:hypothetical protein